MRHLACFLSALLLAACQQAPQEANAVREADVPLAGAEAANRDEGANATLVDNAMRSARATRAAIANAADAAAAEKPTTAENVRSIVPEAMKGEAGARQLLGQWADALERGDWPTARGLWAGHGAASGLSPKAFAAAYDKYRRMKVEIGKGSADAGAGSLYYEAPVTITGLTEDGAPFRITGPVTLRRVNDVDGATPEQLRWHIERSDLKRQ